MQNRYWRANGVSYALQITYSGQESITYNNNTLTVKATPIPDLAWSDGQWAVNKALLKGTSHLLFAGYDSDDRLLDVVVKTLDPKKPATLSGIVEQQSGFRYQLLLVDDQFNPLCESLSVN